jgi:hypothetical protein
MGGAYSAHGRDEECVKMLVGNPEGRRPLERPRHRYKNNIKMNLKQIEWEVVD